MTPLWLRRRKPALPAFAATFSFLLHGYSSFEFQFQLFQACAVCPCPLQDFWMWSRPDAVLKAHLQRLIFVVLPVFVGVRVDYSSGGACHGHDYPSINLAWSVAIHLRHEKSKFPRAMYLTASDNCFLLDLDTDGLKSRKVVIR